MSEYTDELVSQHLIRFPRLATAYLEEPGFHYEVNVLRAVLDDVEVALKQFGIGRSDAERVLCAVMMRRDETEAVHLERTSVMQRELSQRFAAMLDVPVELLRGTEDTASEAEEHVIVFPGPVEIWSGESSDTKWLTGENIRVTRVDACGKPIMEDEA